MLRPMRRILLDYIPFLFIVKIKKRPLRTLQGSGGKLERYAPGVLKARKEKPVVLIEKERSFGPSSIWQKRQSCERESDMSARQKRDPAACAASSSKAG